MRYPQINVKLIGEDGNAFAIIGMIARALREQASKEEAEQFTKEAFAAGSYDELLTIAGRWVNIYATEEDNA